MATKTEPTTDQMMSNCGSSGRGATTDQTAARKDGPRISTMDQRMANNSRSADQHTKRDTPRRR
jgi:hypothetical protein